MKSPSPVPTTIDVLPFSSPASLESPTGRRRLTGSFITRSGYVEPMIATSLSASDEDAGRGWISSKTVFGLNTFSESEALVQLHRCLAETGQLAVRTADALLDVWFAGIGDSDDLFIEFVPRGRPADDHGGIRCGLCSLHEAETLLRDIYQGVESQDLFTSWLAGSRKPQAAPEGDARQMADMTTVDGNSLHLAER